jgi:hypothetical protein
MYLDHPKPSSLTPHLVDLFGEALQVHLVDLFSEALQVAISTTTSVV